MSEYNSNSSKTLPSVPMTSTVPLAPTPPSNAPTVNLAQPTPKEKIELKTNPIQYYIKASFMITYILLLTTATITFIEAMRTKIPDIRHVLNLETCISIVAGYFYSLFLAQIEGFTKDGKEVDWADITRTRYIDWSITTPMMLLALCIVLGMNTNQKVGLLTIASILLLNYIMLYIGYLGETEVITRVNASIFGFIPFFIMFFIVFIKFVKPKYAFSNYALYFFYLIVWGMYGIVYLLPQNYKNIVMNVLDCIAKCLIGLGLWAYYSKIIVV